MVARLLVPAADLVGPAGRAAAETALAGLGDAGRRLPLGEPADVDV